MAIMGQQASSALAAISGLLVNRSSTKVVQENITALEAFAPVVVSLSSSNPSPKKLIVLHCERQKTTEAV